MQKAIPIILVAAGLLLSGTAMADKRPNHGHPGHSKHAQQNRQDDAHGHERASEHNKYGNAPARFEDHQRTIVREYYGEQFRSGNCPPGLRKKNNGCLPPGQAKKWQIGHPLPHDTVFYDLPPKIVAELGPPPPRHRYVRVATDVLLIAIGTGVVLDAIEDLGKIN